MICLLDASTTAFVGNILSITTPKHQICTPSVYYQTHRGPRAGCWIREGETGT